MHGFWTKWRKIISHTLNLSVACHMNGVRARTADGGRAADRWVGSVRMPTSVSWSNARRRAVVPRWRRRLSAGHLHAVRLSGPYYIYLFIYLLCKSYQDTRKIMQKAQKERKKQTHKIYKKKQKNTSHGAYIVHNRLYIWPRKPTGQCCLTISNNSNNKSTSCIWTSVTSDLAHRVI